MARSAVAAKGDLVPHSVSAETRQRIYDYIASRGEKGATDPEINAALKMDGETSRPRRWELAESGLIKVAGKRDRKATGTTTDLTIWIATSPQEKREMVTALIPLEAGEKKELAQHEKEIDRCSKNLTDSFIEMGYHLAAIRDGRLYRETYGRFADYCQKRWDVKIQYADRLMNSHRIIEHLKSTPTGVLPASERQCRPLTTIRKKEDGKSVIDLEAVGGIWQKVQKTAPKDKDGKPIITAARVTDAVFKHRKGKPSPARKKRKKTTPQLVESILKDVKTLMAQVKQSTKGTALQRQRVDDDLRLCRTRVREACQFLV